jgi:hypothetical protein
MKDSWIDILAQKAYEIELLASWASIVGYGDMRDHLRMAKARVMERIEDRKENLAAAAAVGSQQ